MPKDINKHEKCKQNKNCKTGKLQLRIINLFSYGNDAYHKEKSEGSGEPGLPAKSRQNIRRSLLRKDAARKLGIY